MKKDYATLYDEDYYREHCGGIPYERSAYWLGFFSAIAGHIVRSLKPGSVLDAGCAWGFLVEGLRDCGAESWGIDISEYAISHVRTDMRPYCRAGSLTEPANRRYELITCIEVLEHLPPAQASQALKNLCAATDCILFSSTPNDFEEATHFNVQPLIAWLRAFRAEGFSPDVTFDASFVCPHAFLVRRHAQPATDEVLAVFSDKLQGQIDLFEKGRQLEQHVASAHAFEADRDRWKREAEALHAELDAMRRQLVRTGKVDFPVQHAEIERLARHLEAEYDSPAWQLILKYRAWVTRARGHVLVRNVFEPALLSILRRFGIGAAPTAPGSPAASEATPAELPKDPYQEWIRENEPDGSGLALQTRMSAEFAYRPKISVITPVYNVPLEIVREMVASVRNQSYGNWELCLAHGYPGGEEVRRYLQTEAAGDPRIKVRLLPENLGISGNSNAALALATGEFIAVLDHDDTLAPFALFEVVQALNDDPSADFLYSDRDLISEGTNPQQRFDPLFKPDWSPEILLCANYLTHLCVLRSEVVRELGGWRVETDGAQDYDLYLRFLSPGRRVRHIPKVLYHWRQIATSVASRGFEAKPFATRAQLIAVQNYCKGQGWDVSIQEPGAGKDVRVIWRSKPDQAISIILVTAGAGPEALLRVQAGLHSVGDLRVDVVLAGRGPALLAEAVREARGDILIFLDESVVPAEPGWLEELIGPLQNPAIGIVGAKLLDSRSRTIRHAGIIFNSDGRPQYIYGGENEYFYGMFAGPGWYRNWSAVSGACFAMRREVWEKVISHGAEEASWSYPRLDIDLCLKVQLQLGLRVAYNPHARMFQSQTSTLEAWLGPEGEEQAARYIRSCFPNGDPHFHPGLNLDGGQPILACGKVDLALIDYRADSEILVTSFDFTPEQLADSKRLSSNTGELKIERITWFLPEFANPYYGGVHTVLRFAALFAEKHNVHSTFAILGNINTRQMHRRIAAVFPSLASAADVRAVVSGQALRDLPHADASIATFWTTAYSLLKFNQTRRKFYFIQDYEALFYPAGSTSGLVEATYDFGFTGICNTVTLRELYAGRGGSAEYFDPCVDPGIFFSGPHERGGSRPLRLFCYARPGHSRNSFELLMAALKIVKQRFGDEVSIVTAGADWDPEAYGLDGIVRNLGVLGYRSTGALYRACDAGVVAMMTRHPSYLPLEMMACGCAVVTNRNLATRWLLKDGENCLLADSSASSTAAAIEEVLRNSELRSRLTTTAAEMVERKYSDWSAQGDKIFEFMAGESERSRAVQAGLI